MYLYIELWSAKDAWIRLPEEKRQAMVNQLLDEARKNPITGVVPVSVREVGNHVLFDGVTETPAIIDDSVARPTGFRYVAAWMIPTLDLIDKFEKRVESLGWWFDYFDQVNAWGVMDPRAVLGEMTSPPESSARGAGPAVSSVGRSQVAETASSPPATRTSGSDEFDYVVVGAGSSGCVIASRLSEDPDVSVLLLEAGGSEIDARLDEVQLMGSEYDWKYQTEPEPQLENRRIAWPRGKVLGGSSAIAGKIYIRGHPLDYDHWKSLGNEGWAYDDVLPYFKKTETNGRFHDSFHGNAGPLSVESISASSPLKQAFPEAAASCGFAGDPNWDFNGAKQEGVAGYYQFIERNGHRLSVAAAFLTPVLGRSNLTTLPRCLTRKIVWDHNRAVGVEYVTGDWEVRTARARREVIVCAGAIGSPQLLMLSGVGPAQHLRRHQIPLKADLVGVGQNLQDHLQISLRFRPNATAGKISHLGGTSGLFVRTSHCSASSSPDLQLFAVEAVVPRKMLGLEPGPMYMVTACLVRPHSSGSISLASNDPLAKPVIRANYLEDGRDLAGLADGVDLIRRLAGSGPLDRLLDGELMSGSANQSGSEVRAAIRERAGTNFHPVGTCKMGNDHRAVVDSKLRARGLEGLRVADASIMPTIINGNTNAASIMIGEMAAELIKNSRKVMGPEVTPRMGRDH